MTDSQTAIKVQNLSKRYRIGLKEETHDTLAATLANYVRSPLHNLRRLRRLTSFADRPQPTTNGNNPSSTVHRPSSDPDIIWALKDVSFEVKQGEVVGVIGRNGAGKSTLLKILSRITHPTSGRVELNGRVSSLLEVGTGFHPELTGRENIYLNGTILGMRKAEIDRKFDEIVDFSGVEKFIDTPVKRYSSGMRVRLAFSVAAHLEPEILLVDEVLAVGDAAFQKKCLGKIDRIAGEGRTVLIVSHNMSSIQNLCSEAILLELGKVSFVGQPNEVISEYLSTYSNKSADIDLMNHPIRSNTTTATIKRLRVLNERLEPCTDFPIGSTIVFELHLVSSEVIHNPNIGIGVDDMMGQRICSFLTSSQHNESWALTGNQIVRCYWHEFRLRPGTYSISLSIEHHGQRLDWLPYIAQVESVVLDIYGTGKNHDLNIRNGLIAPVCEWKMV